ncbi:hypothetical protein [Bradyrhizobium sp. CSS354]|uniref:hypothetical protein n=1 Tax=Bradyrhizobium sp. CSS354 TaxID=2699172 RepID=UPI0023AF5E0D|nr:hypothetical protein [Bradyrhizobium sp. CSS354]MDE5464715.1 hypothetical protein [Bradyrhizobium sp. CSS354]
MNRDQIGRKMKVFVETTVWASVDILLQHRFRDKANTAEKRDFANRCLLTLEELGYTVSDRDLNDNLVFRPTAKLLEQIGTQPGPLEWRGHYFPDHHDLHC